MDDDMEEFRHIFLEECLENAELLERGLMRMDAGEADADTVNEVFRAAHSIKGGGATFGYQPMAELTHFMETLLDEMRSGRREICPDDVDLLLQGLDLVQTILTDSREQGVSGDHPDRLDLQALLQSAVDAKPGDTANREETISEAEADTQNNSWCIGFTPFPAFFLRGNNPLLFIRELQRLGECTVRQNRSKLPQWTDFDASQCYLSWEIDIKTNVEEAALRDIFEWVDTDCELSVIRLDNEVTSRTEAISDDIKIENTIEAVQPTDVTGAPSTPVADPVAVKKQQAQGSGAATNSESSTIRIATDKIDQLINLVGELVITQSMLSRVTDSQHEIDVDELRERMTDLEHHTRDLQESVMQVRMLPISSAFSRLPRLVRDLSKKLNKEVDLVLAGESTELDKTVLERMIDPLVHLVRNGLDHGLETPEERIACGKPSMGQLKIEARQESGSIVIEIVDDGKGINEENVLRKARENGIVGDEVLNSDQINQLIFAPGFSMADTISDVSGRGVGMDVVRRNILDLGGRVHVHSTFGKGTRIEIILPLSLAILDGQLVRVAGQDYVIPILSIIETLESSKTECSSVPSTGDVFQYRGEYLRLINISRYFDLPDTSSGELIVVVSNHGKRVGLMIDEVLGQQQVVVKPLDRNYRNVQGFAGATIMSDGAVALILDPANITEPECRGIAA